MNIYVRIEVLAREFQGRLLLALVAAERGHEVLMGKHNAARVVGIGSKAGYPPGILHDKSLGVNDPKSEVKKLLYARGWGLTAQDEEHGLSTSSFASAEMISRFPLDSFERNHLVFAWGNHDHQAIQQLLPNDRDRIVATGSPRADFWRPELRGVHDVDDIFQWTHGAPFVLFAPAGPLASAATVAGEGHRQRLRWQAEVEAAQWIARCDPRTLVVVRPHPAQFLDEWRSAFQGSPPNLVVIRDERASVWVRHAAVVISNGSTLAFEACIMGVPHINFAPGGDFVFGSKDDGFTHQLGPAAIDLEALSDAVADAQSSTRSRNWYSEEALRGVKSRFSALSGPLAADRIVDEWERLAGLLRLNESPSVADRAAEIFSTHDLEESSLTRSFFGRRRSRSRLSWTHRKSAAPGVPNKRPEKAPYREKFPPFDRSAVERLHRRLEETTGRFAHVRMRPIHDRMMLFTRD